MHYQGSLGSPGFFDFDVNGVSTLTLCDQFNPAITTEPYYALIANLNDLTGTTLFLAGDPLALEKYTKVGLIALQAYLNPALAGDATWAMRYIVDGSGRITNGAQTLLDWVALQNPANYPQLANFKIYAPVMLPGYILPTQEQVGFDNPTPEPGTVVLIGGGLAAVLLVRRRRANAL